MLQEEVQRFKRRSKADARRRTWNSASFQGSDQDAACLKRTGASNNAAVQERLVMKGSMTCGRESAAFTFAGRLVSPSLRAATPQPRIFYTCFLHRQRTNQRRGLRNTHLQSLRHCASFNFSAVLVVMDASSTTSLLMKLPWSNRPF
jgi:hypothetical protein